MPSRTAIRHALALTTGLVVAGALAGCGGHKDQIVQTETTTIGFAGLGHADAGGSTGSNAQTVSVTVPGYAAKLNVPGLELGGSDMMIDGMHLHPGTRLSGMVITGNAGDGSGGESRAAVDMRFVDPAAPAQVLAYYRQAAQQGGWTEVPPAAGQQFAATKHITNSTEHLAMQVGAGTSGTTGRMTVTSG